MEKFEQSELLTARQTSQLATISANTLHEWAKRRDAGLDAPGPPHVQLGPGARRWLRSDVIAWLESCRVVNPSDRKRA